MPKFYQNSKLTLLFVAVFCELINSEVPRPRGVSLSRTALYPPDRDFTCFDGSKTIQFTQVNDDYCDCADASDEPGTSACPNGLFHCSNSGHKPVNIPSNRVNDGICDCCDGSDEYGGVKSCQNSCLELGRAAREEAQRRAELVKAGKQLKAEMSRQGIQLKEESKNKLEELLKSKDEAARVKDEKQELKRQAEELENKALEYYRQLEDEARQKKLAEEREKHKNEGLDAFERFDSNSDGILEISELQTRQTFDKDKNGEVSEEEAKFFLNNEQQVDRETFVEKCWSLIKPLLMREAGLFKAPSNEEKSENEETEADDLHDDEDLDENDEGTETGDEEADDEEIPHEEEEKSDSSVAYDEETQQLVEKATKARKYYTEAETQFRNLERDIKGLEESLEIDFGPEEEFAPLKGECFEYTDYEYVYKLCPFDRTSQTPKSSSSETRLGTWGHWANDKGPKYETMVYENGQNCWNGPQRSTVVKISCGSENKVTSVSEPNRCEYLFGFTTPAACREAEATENDVHDEL